MTALLTIFGILNSSKANAWNPDGIDQRDFWAYETDDSAPSASDILVPITSFLLPGFGQWTKRQIISASAYSGVAIASARYSLFARKEVGWRSDPESEYDSKNVAMRKVALGLQTYQAAGGLSLYHSFRSAVWQRQKYGQYRFLEKSETPIQLLSAPFRFEYIERPSTFIPLLIGASASFYFSRHPPENFTRTTLRREDAWFSGAFSYNAGTHEEAIFRGWFMPVLRESGFSPEMSNIGQGVLFALAHLGTYDRPWPQLFLGLHLGRVAQKNEWTLGESIFIHTWWDVLAFLSAYSLEKKNVAETKRTAANTSPMEQKLRLVLPPISISF